MKDYLFIQAVIIVTVILIIAAYSWYHLYGWSTFSFNVGDSVKWSPDANYQIERLRFKDCIFTVTPQGGASASINVSSTLNGMAVAYKGTDNQPAVLYLVRNLNPFSFIIPGFNDSDTTAAALAGEPQSCTSDSQCPYGTVPGACSPKGGCVNATNGPNVTLTGKYKTL